MIEYVEDLISAIATQYAHTVTETDAKLFKSLHKQLSKRTPLTDKQHVLVADKLSYYQSVIEPVLGDVTDVVSRIRYPVRTVDRSKWIRVMDESPVHSKQYFSYQNYSPTIAVRFPFKKTSMRAMSDVRKRLECHEVVLDRVHYFPYSERNLVMIVNRLRGMNFEMDVFTQNLYQTIQSYDKKTCCVGISDGIWHNAPESLINHAHNELGPVTTESLLLYQDRSISYGIDWFNTRDIRESRKQYTALSAQIASRSMPTVAIDPGVYAHEQLVDSLCELQRFPVLFILPKHNSTEIIRLHDHIKNRIDKDRISVILKSTDPDLNWLSEYHNEITPDTQVVYALDTLLVPRRPLSLGWCPRTLVLPESTKITNCIKLMHFYKNLDLTILYAARLSNRYGRTQKL